MAHAPEDDCAKDAARQNTLEFSLAGGLADLGAVNVASRAGLNVRLVIRKAA